MELHPHARLHAPEARSRQGKTGLGVYADGMVEHDGMVGQLLDKLEELGIEDNTIVMYSTDNGAESFTWPDGGTTMFRGEKNTQWEGGYPRAVASSAGPASSSPARSSTTSARMRTCCRPCWPRRATPTVKEDLLKGRQVGDTTFKVHLDGYNLLPALKGEGEWPRHEFLYWTDDGSVAALRYDNWKITFLRQNAHGMHVWVQPFEELRAPMLDQSAHGSVRARRGRGHGLRALVSSITCSCSRPPAATSAQWLQSFREFPPRQKPGSFNLDRVMEAVTSGNKNEN